MTYDSILMLTGLVQKVYAERERERERKERKKEMEVEDNLTSTQRTCRDTFKDRGQRLMKRSNVTGADS